MSENPARGTTSICGFDADTISVRGHDLVDDLIGKRSFTEAFLLQALGAEPSPHQSAIVDAVLVTIMEHGLVPSAVVTRLTHYVAADDSAAQAREEVRSYRAIKRPLPGFGHPIHRDSDPRVARLLAVTEGAGVDGHYIAAMQLLEKTLSEELGRELVTNISAAIAALGRVDIT